MRLPRCKGVLRSETCRSVVVENSRRTLDYCPWLPCLLLLREEVKFLPQWRSGCLHQSYQSPRPKELRKSWGAILPLWPQNPKQCGTPPWSQFCLCLSKGPGDCVANFWAHVLAVHQLWFCSAHPPCPQGHRGEVWPPTLLLKKHGRIRTQVWAWGLM